MTAIGRIALVSGVMARKASGVLLVFTGLLLGMTTLAFPIDGSWDFATYSIIGRTLLQGGVPYRDAWDINGPAIYVTYALSSVLLGNGDMAIRVFDIVWQIGTAIVVTRIGWRVFKNQAVGTIAGFGYLIVYFSRNSWDMGQPESFLTLPLALYMLILLCALDDDRFLSWAHAAFWLGIVVLFKLPVGLCGIIALLAALGQGTKPLTKVARRLVALGVGFSVPLLVCGFYFYTKGVLPDFLITELVLAPQYAGRFYTFFSLQCMVNGNLQPVNIPSYMMAAAGIATLAVAMIQGHKLSLTVKLLLAWLGSAFLVIFLRASFVSIHYTLLLAPSAILGANAIVHLLDPLQNKPKRWRVLTSAFLSICVVVAVIKLSQNTAYAWSAVTGELPLTARQDLGRFLSERTSSEDRIFVWGDATPIYYYADRQSSSRFIHTYFLSIPWNGVDYRATFIREFLANKPKYFVLIKGEVQGACPVGRVGFTSSYNQFDALNGVIKSEYIEEQNTDRYILYRREVENPTSLQLPAGPS